MGMNVVDGLCEIRINNWDKYNPRNDRANHSWFKFLNNFFSDPKIYILEPIQKLTLIFLFCEASKSGSGTVLIAEQRVCSDLGVNKEYLTKTIQTLTALDVIAPSSRRHSDTNLRSQEQDAASLLLTTDRQTDITEQTDISAVVTTQPKASKTLGSEVWESYKAAFKKRYGVDPKHNAKVFSQCKQVGNRIGKDAVPAIAFYLTNNDGWLLKNQHPVGAFLQNAEGYCTQWERGQAVTGAQVRQVEKVSTTMDLLQKVQKGEA